MKTLFEEKQRFTQWWLWLILVASTILVIGVVATGIYTQFVVGEPWGDDPMSNTGLIVFSLWITICMAGLLCLFYFAELDVNVDSAGISYRYPPLIWRQRRLGREEIEEFRRKKVFLAGYGIRFDFRGNKTINVKGQEVIQLTLSTGKKLSLGTQKPEAFEAAVQQMKKEAPTSNVSKKAFRITIRSGVAEGR